MRPVYEVAPLQGIGPIRFGMTREESRQAMAIVPRPVARFAGSPPQDMYYESSFQVHFDETDRVVFIEVAASREFAADYKGHKILRMSPGRAVALVDAGDKYDRNDPEVGYAYAVPR